MQFLCKFLLCDFSFFSGIKQNLSGIKSIGFLIELCPFRRALLSIFSFQYGAIVIYLMIVCLHSMPP